MYLGNFGKASQGKSSCIGSDLFNIILYVEVFYPIHILLILLDIMVALQTLKGNPNMHAENVPEWVNSSARDRK